MLSNLVTSERQFDFKKGLGCSHAINLVRNTINLFNKKGSTINLGLIDIRKAFDRSNYWGILVILQKKLINPTIIDILEHWFSLGSARIVWNNCISESVSLEAGVRQGGILSPLLFSIFIDEILSELSNSKLGCFLHGRCLNRFLYADDLLLLSPTVCDLQLLFDKCSSILDELDLQINPEKSCCLRIGNRCGALCSPIVVNNLTLK